MKRLKKAPLVPLTLLVLVVIALGIVLESNFPVKAQGGVSAGLWYDLGIGAVGNAREDASGVFAVTDTGTDLWGTNDEFHYVYQLLNGDGQITARVLGMNGTNDWAKAGVMIRETLDADSRNVMMFESLRYGARFEWRSTAGGQTILGLQGAADAVMPCWVRLERHGDWIGGYSSPDGTNWTLVDWEWLGGLAPQVYVGLAFSGHDQHRAASTAWFDQVSFIAGDFARTLNPAAGTGDGLKASYFDNRHLYGRPATNWIDPQIDCDAHVLREEGNRRTDEFGIRWTGELQAQFTEPYTFYAMRDDGVRVWLDEQLIIDDWKSHQPDEVSSAPINLVAGRRYLLRVEYFQNHGWARISLSWSSPSTPKHVIPQNQLYSRLTDTDGNGLPDLWEVHYFGRIGVDSNADPDRDGLSNLQEYQRWSNPVNPLHWGVPNAWTHGDIEDWGTSDGNVTYANGIFTLSISATNGAPHWHYVYRPLGTNGELVARVLGIRGNDIAKAGIMLRERLDSQARNVMLQMTPSNGMAFPLRETIGGPTVQNQGTNNPLTPYWLKVVRNNDWLGGYESWDGTNWTLLDWEYLNALTPQAFIGLAVEVEGPQGFPHVRTTAQFDQIYFGPAEPAEILYPAEGNGDGLLVGYRNDSLLYLPGTTNRVEPQENYYWVHGPPFPFLNPDGYGVCWSGEIQAEFTEPYKFSIQTRREDWVRMWLNDQLIIDGWRKWHPDYKVYSDPVSLVAGRHYLIRVEMYDNLGQGVSILRWTSPSTPEHLIAQNQLYSQPVLDPAGSSLPVIWERIYFGHTGVEPSADRDGDGLSNLQEYQNHTDPTKADTDEDGIPDGWEIARALDPQFDDAGLDYDNSGWNNLQRYLYGLDPFNPDVNNDGLPDVFEVADLGLDITVSHADLASVVASANGVEATNFLGTWAVDGNEIYALDRRGGMDFILSVTNADKYVLNLVGTQNQADSPVTHFKLLLGIDGQTLGRFTLNAPYGVDGRVEALLPYLRDGPHTLWVFWDGVASFNSLRIKQVKLLAVSGTETNQTGLKDWVLRKVGTESGLDLTNKVIGSYTSPVCLEGRDPYPKFMALINNQTNVLSPIATTDGRWHVNVPLLAATQIVIQASFQNGARTETRELQWLPVNLLTASNMTIRLGDALLFTVMPSSDVHGTLYVSIGTNTYSGVASRPIPCRFTAPGIYTVNGIFTAPSGTTQSGSVTVNVVQQNLPDIQPAAWTWMQRPLVLNHLARETVLQADSRLSSFLSGTNADGGAALILATGVNEDLSLIARLGTNGPVLDSVPVSGFDEWAGAQTYTTVLEVYPDGSQLIETLLISSPVETNVTFVLEPIVGGVIFDDGTVIKTLTATNFDALGQCRVRFIRPSTAQTSICHSIKAYQGPYQIGYLH